MRNFVHILRISSLRKNYNPKLGEFSYRILERECWHVSIAKKDLGFFSQPPNIVVWWYYWEYPTFANSTDIIIVGCQRLLNCDLIRISQEFS